MAMTASSTGGEPEDELAALLRRAGSATADEDLQTGMPDVDSNAQTTKEFLAQQFRVAEKLLALQHEDTLERFAARRSESSVLEDRVNQLAAENKRLREDLANVQVQAAKGILKPGRQIQKGGTGVFDVRKSRQKDKTQMATEQCTTSNGARDKIRPTSPPRASSLRPKPPDSENLAELGVDDDGSATSAIPGFIESLSEESPDTICVSAKRTDSNYSLAQAWQSAAEIRETKKSKKSSLKASASMRNTTKFSRSTSRALSIDSGDDEDLCVVEKQKMAQSNSFLGRRMVHPYNQKKGAWDIVSLVLVIFDVVWIPLGFFPMGDGVFVTFMKWVTRTFWTLDFPFSFFCGFVTRSGTIELRLWPVARRYLKSWFILDVIVVGVDWLEFVMQAGGGAMAFARFGKASRVLRILRMIRLLRLARMREVLDGIIEKLNSEKLVIIIDITKLMAYMLGTGHIIACMWFYVATFDMEVNWFKVKEEENPGLYKKEDCIDELEAVGMKADHPYPCGHVTQLYIMSLRWAVSQFAGGMDEVVPVHSAEHFYAGLVFISCFWSGAVFIGILTSSMTQLYIISSQQQTQLTVLRRYLRQNMISKNLALRVTRNAQYALQERSSATPEAAVELVAIVSEPLRVELHFEMYSHTLATHPFFKRYIEECPHVIRRVCHSSMKMYGISKGDVIFNVGEIPKKPRMLIISYGEVHYTRMSNGKALKTVLKAGSWICEACLWVSWTHRGQLTAKEYTRMYALDAAEFQLVATSFEQVNFNPIDYAVDYLDCINELDVEEVSDLPLAHQMEFCKGIADSDPIKKEAMDRLSRDQGFESKLSDKDPKKLFGRGRGSVQRQSGFGHQRQEGGDERLKGNGADANDLKVVAMEDRDEDFKADVLSASDSSAIPNAVDEAIPCGLVEADEVNRAADEWLERTATQKAARVAQANEKNRPVGLTDVDGTENSATHRSAALRSVSAHYAGSPMANRRPSDIGLGGQKPPTPTGDNLNWLQQERVPPLRLTSGMSFSTPPPGIPPNLSLESWASRLIDEDEA